jgi:iron complex transport system substrate-binding protein
MRIISLVPAATEIIFAMGLGDQLVGRTHACDYPDEVADVPVVTADDPAAPGQRLDRALLARLEPDLVLADGSEDEPLVDYAEISAVVGSLRRDVTLVALAPQSVEGILNSISTVGAFTEAEYEAIGLIEMLRERLHRVEPDDTDGVRRTGDRRVVVLEALDPPVPAGRWVPEMVRRAGGWELLGREGEPSAATTWERLRELEPEVLVLALRDSDAAGAARALESAPLPTWFDELEAVRDGEFFAVDGRGLFARPGPRVIDGIAVLAELLEPHIYAGAGPVEAWTPLAPVGVAGGRRAHRGARTGGQRDDERDEGRGEERS